MVTGSTHPAVIQRSLGDDSDTTDDNNDNTGANDELIPWDAVLNRSQVWQHSTEVGG